MKPKFELDGNTLQFSKGIRYPVRKPMEKMQVNDRTASGEIQTEDFGTTINSRPIHFKGLPDADYEALINWFDIICNGAENQFTYYDEKGISHLVIMLTNPFNFQQDSYGRWSGHLLLEIVG